MKFYLIPLIFLFACNSATDGDGEVDSSNVQSRDTVIVKKDSLITLPPAFTIGFYQGVTPCADCPGIQHILLLDSSNNYTLEEVQWGKNAFPTKATGKWDRDADTLQLYKGKQVESIYHIRYDTLYPVKVRGKMVYDQEAREKMLFRRAAFKPNETIMKKVNEGIEFYAIGNEPFWNLEIDMQKMILFKLADWTQPVIVPISKPRSNKDSVVYASADTSGLRIAILNKFCNDGMSDFLYKNTVNVTYKGQTYRGCGVLLKP